MRKGLLGLALLLGMGQAPLPPKVVMAYADSWRETHALAAGQTALARSPGYVNLIALSFGRPDMVYQGGLSLSGTGYDYAFSGGLLREAIAVLKRRHPATRVVLSIGSGAYGNWAGLREGDIARLARDLEADGVDIDYEPQPACAPRADGRVACPTDPTLVAVTRRLRTALPRPLLLTAALPHVGAYGEGAYRQAPPAGSPAAGFALGLLRSSAAADLDLVAVMAYDAGPTYDPMQGYRAYRAAWKGRLALGVEVPMKGATGPFYTVARTETLARQVARDPGGAMMVYSMLEPPDPPTATPDHPDGAMLEAAACRGLGMEGCGKPAPSPGR